MGEKGLASRVSASWRKRPEKPLAWQREAIHHSDATVIPEISSTTGLIDEITPSTWATSALILSPEINAACCTQALYLKLPPRSLITESIFLRRRFASSGNRREKLRFSTVPNSHEIAELGYLSPHSTTILSDCSSLSFEAGPPLSHSIRRKISRLRVDGLS
jgi:hypothetical protein